MIKTILSSLLLLISFIAQADDNVFRAQFTTQISDKEPVDNITKLENSFTSVYFFTDIQNCVNCKVEHVWFHDGKEVYTYKTTPKGERWRTWSKKTLSDSLLGKWTIKVKVNGKTRVTRNLSYYAPTKAEIQQAPIEKRLRINELEQCEEKLRYFSKMNDEDPDDPYFKFMLNKWGNRCYGE